jgi:hypothetical protein
MFFVRTQYSRGTVLSNTGFTEPGILRNHAILGQLTFRLISKCTSAITVTRILGYLLNAVIQPSFSRSTRTPVATFPEVNVTSLLESCRAPWPPRKRASPQIIHTVLAEAMTHTPRDARQSFAYRMHLGIPSQRFQGTATGKHGCPAHPRIRPRIRECRGFPPLVSATPGASD